MDQITFSDAEYQTKKRKTRRELFLERMGRLIPWTQLEKKVVVITPKARAGGLRIRCLSYYAPTACRCSEIDFLTTQVKIDVYRQLFRPSLAILSG